MQFGKQNRPVWGAHRRMGSVRHGVQIIYWSTGSPAKAITELLHSLCSMSLCELLHRDALLCTLHRGVLWCTQRRDEQCHSRQGTFIVYTAVPTTTIWTMDSCLYHQVFRNPYIGTYWSTYHMANLFVPSFLGTDLFVPSFFGTDLFIPSILVCNSSCCPSMGMRRCFCGGRVVESQLVLARLRYASTVGASVLSAVVVSHFWLR